MFYILRSAQKKGAVILEFIDKELDNRDLFSGTLKTNNPYNAKIAMQKHFYDANFFNDGLNIAVSERFIRILNDNNLKGWNTYDLKIMEYEEGHYYGLQIIGKSGELDKPKKKGFYTGYRFDHSTWDGSDFFSPKGTALVFCTEKVKNILIKNKVTNIEFQDITTVEAYSKGL